MNLKNKSGDTNKKLRPLGQPHSFFKRVRVLASDQVVEDIQDFNRYMELVSSLQNEAVRANNDIQGFGGRWDSSQVSKTTDVLTASGSTLARVAAARASLLPVIDAGK